MGGSTAAPEKFCAFVSIDSGSGELTQSLEFSDLRSLAFGFCQFLAALGIFFNSKTFVFVPPAFSLEARLIHTPFSE